MPLPGSNSNNPFVIPSLIPPLASSSSSTGVNQKENSRAHCTNSSRIEPVENAKKMPSVSLLSKYRQQGTEVSKVGNKSLMSESPDIGANRNRPQRLRRAMQTTELRRKAFSPIDNISSTSNRNNLHVKKTNDSSFCKSPSFASPLPTMPRPSSSIDKYSSAKKKVLLFGETMESLFCLNKMHSTEEQYLLCNGIVDGSRTDDPGTWCRVLELTRAQYQKADSVNDDNAECNKENLVRLHRRATLRFSLRDNQKDLTNSSASMRRQKDIFSIWLSYASIHATVGNLEESRRTFNFMLDNERASMEFSSSDHEHGEESGTASVFYLAYANFESKYGLDNSRARQILLRGIKEKAEPISKLEEALTVLDCSDDGSMDVTRRFRMKGTPASGKKKDVSLGSIKFEINPSPIGENYSASQIKRRHLGSNVSEHSPKRRRSSEREPFSTRREHEQTASSEKEGDQTNSGFESRKKASMDAPSMTTSCSKKVARNSSVLGETSIAPTAIISRSSSQGKPPVSKTRLALTSRLTRKGLSGKAKRVDCSVTYDDDEFSSDDDTRHTRHDSAKSMERAEELSPVDEPRALSKPKTEKSSKVPSFKKLDLSYMWAWDPNNPNKKGKDQNETGIQKSSDATNSTGSGPSTYSTNHSAIDTQGSGSSVGDTSCEKAIAVASASKNDPPKQSQTLQETTSSGSRVIGKKEESTTGTSDGDTKTSYANVGRNAVGSGNDSTSMNTDDSAMSKRQALVAKANLEFLPLVHEDNILKVRGSTYAKLGVIGKGGSCKVYRALSKKCAVVAIKKVKLAGMDRKAIEGYANEISLLKRLRGNPAIIQMYDSEVDLQRKSIFVVMELGEVDLNHVLQQRALSETSRSLNMNFIRLTWQQMLSAVHCIHEERIIHSDLKPANFLFVRGALKLIDFGIAKAIMNDDTTNIYRENHIGTLNYMSPEAILDTGSGQDGPRMKIGRASDVWSLGCILYEMVYGKTPFYKLHFIQKLQAIVNPSHKINYPEDDEAEAAIDAMKLCLRRNPEDRPPIVGKDGLLNEHWFLHSKRRPH